MKTSMFLRLSLLATALGAALSAHAVDAYNNLGPAPDSYQPGVPYYNLAGFVQGPQFTASVSGTLQGFSLAINNFDAVGPAAFTLKLYADSGSDKLGALLGTYSGLSTGNDVRTATSGVVGVAATGPSVSLVGGARYWLIAETAESLGWSHSISARGNRYSRSGNVEEYSLSYLPAFSVQVDPVPEPASMAALGLGALGLLRRRKAA